jgi:hypothetical protein
MAVDSHHLTVHEAAAAVRRDPETIRRPARRLATIVGPAEI